MAHDCAECFDTREKEITTPGTNKNIPTKKQSQNTKLGKANNITPLKIRSPEPNKAWIKPVSLIKE